ncbi:hypothetical protein HYC85_023210 [Camellia sinensis]|uniref:Uncharacterized protein n=1 Tax=Camellia sinensis TaxID=4442 RepID=A0A7J7GG94_CAMSI|nr:hypothetical protein HYC85_023210 [Camellia sinensis]
MYALIIAEITNFLFPLWQKTYVNLVITKIGSSFQRGGKLAIHNHTKPIISIDNYPQQAPNF